MGFRSPSLVPSHMVRVQPASYHYHYHTMWTNWIPYYGYKIIRHEDSTSPRPTVTRVMYSLISLIYRNVTIEHVAKAIRHHKLRHHQSAAPSLISRLQPTAVDAKMFTIWVCSSDTSALEIPNNIRIPHIKEPDGKEEEDGLLQQRCRHARPGVGVRNEELFFFVRVHHACLEYPLMCGALLGIRGEHLRLSSTRSSIPSTSFCRCRRRLYVVGRTSKPNPGLLFC